MIKELFRTDESKFNISIALKFSAVPIFTMFFTGVVLWFFAEINLLFFMANGFNETVELKEAYFEFITEDVLHILPHVFLIIIASFFVGLYISFFLLRPFNEIGSYCMKKASGENATLKNKRGMNFKLATDFGNYFFTWLDERLKDGKLVPNTIPTEYQKIHGAIFEKPFFVFYTLIVSGLTILTSVTTYFVGVSIHEKIVQLAIDVLKNKDSLKYFLQGQAPLIMIIMFLIVGVMILLYIILAINLYGRISGASFAFFSTMRSFMKGDFSARVHLVEYRYVRDNGRFLNKYLNYVNDISKNNPN